VDEVELSMAVELTISVDEDSELIVEDGTADVLGVDVTIVVVLIVVVGVVVSIVVGLFVVALISVVLPEVEPSLSVVAVFELADDTAAPVVTDSAVASDAAVAVVSNVVGGSVVKSVAQLPKKGCIQFLGLETLFRIYVQLTSDLTILSVTHKNIVKSKIL